jgi:hypothetical protein
MLVRIRLLLIVLAMTIAALMIGCQDRTRRTPDSSSNPSTLPTHPPEHDAPPRHPVN